MKHPELDDLSTDQAPFEGTGASASSTRIHWFSRVMESPFLFPAVAILVLAAIWGATLNLIDVEHTQAGKTAAALSHELAATYEAQVVRALREIDMTL